MPNPLAYALIILATVFFAGQNIVYERIHKVGPKVEPCLLLLADVSVLLVGLTWYFCQPQSFRDLNADQRKLWLLVSFLLAGGMVCMLSGYKMGVPALTGALLLMLIPVWIAPIERLLALTQKLHWAHIVAFALGITAVVFALYGTSQTSQPQEPVLQEQVASMR